MDVSMIKKPEDWDFPIPQITADAINDLIAAYARGGSVGNELDDLDGATREMSNQDQEAIIRNYYLREEWDRE